MTDQLHLGATVDGAGSKVYPDTHSGHFTAHGQFKSDNFAALTGTGTYVGSLVTAPTAYVQWMLYVVSIASANSGATTFNFNSLGAINVKLMGAPLTAGQLPAGCYALVIYTGSVFEIIGIAAGGGGGSGVSLTQPIPQTSHGFSVGQVIQTVGVATYTTAIASGAAFAEVVGMVAAVADANNFTILFGGYITGLSGLTANAVHYLSPTLAGALTTTEPSTPGQVSKPLLWADSTTSGYFFNMRGEVISSSGVVTYSSALGAVFGLGLM